LLSIEKISKNIEKYFKKLEDIENHFYNKKIEFEACLYIQSNCLLRKVDWAFIF